LTRAENVFVVETPLEVTGTSDVRYRSTRGRRGSRYGAHVQGARRCLRD
jgi:hypothetical protein